MSDKNKTPDFQNTDIAFASKSDAELYRAKLLFESMNFKSLVTLGPKLITASLKLKLPIKPIIKSTLFHQFCAGETIDESITEIHKMKKLGVGAILDYAAEGSQTEEAFDQACIEIANTIEKASNDKSIPFSVFKPTSMGRLAFLEKVASKEELTKTDKEEWKRITDRWLRLCQKAYDSDVTLMIDAEESWIQTPLDDLALEMMVKFNKKRAVIYTTLQMYRTDRLDYLRELLESAQSKGHHVGVKLVRGAYMEKERERALEMSYPSPIYPDKDATDEAYDQAIAFVINNIECMALCAGTHNENSTLKLTKLISYKKLDPNDSRIAFSQLYGMSDNLTYNLGHGGYNASKYLPYGPVEVVMPYLFRRAEENTAIEGQANRELELIKAELERRKKKD